MSLALLNEMGKCINFAAMLSVRVGRFCVGFMGGMQLILPDPVKQGSLIYSAPLIGRLSNQFMTDLQRLYDLDLC